MADLWAQRAVVAQLGDLGAQLRLARIRAGRTQGDVALAAGISRQLLGRVEAGFNGEIRGYLAVAHALGMRVSLTDEIPLNDAELAALDLINALQPD